MHDGTAYGFLGDQPADKDTLGRHPFAKALAASLMLPREDGGLVVGIEGKLGSGKTTLINLVIKELAAAPPEQAPVVVSFNPWMISATGALTESLIAQIAVAIGADKNAAEKGIEIGEKLLGYLGVFNKLKYLKYVPGAAWAGHIVEAIEDVANASEKAGEVGKSTLGDMRKLLPALDLKAKKEAVGKALKEFGRPIVVVIDDLDRLLPNEIQSIIQAIKAIADFPRTTYLLVYDRAIVASALGKDEQAGSEYLAKIVQVAYPIPSLFNRQRIGLIRTKVEEFLSKVGIAFAASEQSLWEQAVPILARLLPQPRDVVRLINRLIVSVPATRGEVNPVDVIVFEALTLRFPGVRDAIYRNAGDFTGKFRENDDRFSEDLYLQPIEEDGNDSGKWQHHLPQGELGVRSACEFMFELGPRRSFSHSGYLRIASGDRLARLFRMTSIEGVPDVRAVQEMLADPRKLKRELADCDPGEAVLLMSWIRSYLLHCQVIDLVGTARVLFQYLAGLDDQAETAGKVAAGVEELVGSLATSGRAGVDKMLAALAADAPLALAVAIVEDLFRRLSAHRERLQAGNAGTLGGPSEQAIEAAMEALMRRVLDSIECDGLASGREVHQRLLFAQLVLGASDQLDGIFNRLLARDGWLAVFLAGFADSPNRLDALTLIPDLDAFAQRIESSTIPVHDYGVLAEIRSDKRALALRLERKRRRPQPGAAAATQTPE